MDYSFKPTQILNDVGFSLGVSDNYIELFRQGVDMGSCIGWSETTLRQVFDETIKSDLLEFWILYIAEDSEIEIHEPHGRIYYDAAIALGLSGSIPQWVRNQFSWAVKSL
jgi:hypothetical protein